MKHLYEYLNSIPHSRFGLVDKSMVINVHRYNFFINIGTFFFSLSDD